MRLTGSVGPRPRSMNTPHGHDNWPDDSPSRLTDEADGIRHQTHHGDTHRRFHSRGRACRRDRPLGLSPNGRPPLARTSWRARIMYVRAAYWDKASGLSRTCTRSTRAACLPCGVLATSDGRRVTSPGLGGHGPQGVWDRIPHGSQRWRVVIGCRGSSVADGNGPTVPKLSLDMLWWSGPA